MEAMVLVEKREIKSNFLEGNSAKESTHSISLLFIDSGTAALLPRAAFV